MPIPFPGEAWIQAMKDDLNSSSAYREAAKNWEGDFAFVIEPGGALQESVVLYMDLFHGECRAAMAVQDPTTAQAAFRLTGPVAVWKKVMTRKLDPMQAMMTGQLKLTGNMAMVMRNVRAAKELVESCTRIDTEFPL
jgi:putative sterol carrier protein